MVLAFRGTVVRQVTTCDTWKVGSQSSYLLGKSIPYVLFVRSGNSNELI